MMNNPKGINQHTPHMRTRLLRRLHALALKADEVGMGLSKAHVKAAWSINYTRSLDKPLARLVSNGWVTHYREKCWSIALTAEGIEALEDEGYDVPLGSTFGPEARLLAGECGATWAAHLLGESVDDVRRWVVEGTPLDVRARIGSVLAEWRAGRLPMGPFLARRLAA